jgi:hypothetical protein
MEKNEQTQDQNQQDPQEQQTEDKAVDWEAKYREAVAQSRKWEDRAKENKAARDELDELKKSQMSEAERLQAEAKEAKERAEKLAAELEAEKARAERDKIAVEVAEKAGVPVHFLKGETREEMEAEAEELKAYRENRPPAQVFASDGKKPTHQKADPRSEFDQWIDEKL